MGGGSYQPAVLLTKSKLRITSVPRLPSSFCCLAVDVTLP